MQIQRINSLKTDLSSGLVVFLVALPLCLGMALASGAPLLSGIISGILGGIVVGFLSNSQISVSGPAAGLTVIILAAITELGSFELFLTAVVLAGIIQLTLGFLKAGSIAHFFPLSVINGMLTAIGISIIIKQFTHVTGLEILDPATKVGFAEMGHYIAPGALIISLVSLAFLFFWETPLIQSKKGLKGIPAPLIVVFLGIGFKSLFDMFFPSLALQPAHLVSLPQSQGIMAFFGQLTHPDFAALANGKIYTIAFTVAIVASMETLLSLDAANKLDPQKRIADPNKELKAQGLGNILVGLIGGLPITSVIVRSSANINAGAKTRYSAIFHGIFLLLSVLFLAPFLNQIPLAALAAILIQVGYKLNKPAIYKKTFKAGPDQYLPFAITILVILATDLLIGISIGIAVGLFFMIKSNFKPSTILINEQDKYLLRFTRDLYFFNKGNFIAKLQSIPEGSRVLIDGTKPQFMDYDILATLDDFIQAAPSRQISIQLRQSPTATIPLFRSPKIESNKTA